MANNKLGPFTSRETSIIHKAYHINATGLDTSHLQAGSGYYGYEGLHAQSDVTGYEA